jgi:hypothetical protein
MAESTPTTYTVIGPIESGRSPRFSIINGWVTVPAAYKVVDIVLGSAINKTEIAYAEAALAAVAAITGNLGSGSVDAKSAPVFIRDMSVEQLEMGKNGASCTVFVEFSSYPAVQIEVHGVLSQVQTNKDVNGTTVTVQHTYTGPWTPNGFWMGTGTLVSHGGSGWICTTGHYATGSNEPGTSGGSSFWSSSAYPGDDVIPDGMYPGFTDVQTAMMNVDVPEQMITVKFLVVGDLTYVDAWASGTVYPENALVKDGGTAWKCIHSGTHTAGSGNEPGTSGGATYWVTQLVPPITQVNLLAAQIGKVFDGPMLPFGPHGTRCWRWEAPLFSSRDGGLTFEGQMVAHLRVIGWDTPATYFNPKTGRPPGVVTLGVEQKLIQTSPTGSIPFTPSATPWQIATS